MNKIFNDKRTAAVFLGKTPMGFPPDLIKPAVRKLALIDDAMALNNLKFPYGNHLESLKDDRAGQHSIRIHDQWRVCFVWSEGNAINVEIVDYH